MPPTTRASARRAAAGPTYPRTTPVSVSSFPPQRAPSPIQGGTMDLPGPLVAATSSVQLTNTFSLANIRRACCTNRLSLGPVEASLLPQDSESHFPGGKNYHRFDHAVDFVPTVPDLSHHFSNSEGPSTHSADIQPQLPSPCFRSFPTSDSPALRAVINSLNSRLATTSFSLLSAKFSASQNSSFECFDDFDGPDSFEDVNQPTYMSLILSREVFTSTHLSPERSMNSPSHQEIGQELLSCSKPTQPSPAIFSQAERRRIIASSIETAADREKASFIANAVLYRAFSTQSPHYYGRVSQVYSPYPGMRNFPMTSSDFPHPSEKYLPSTLSHRGTDRGKFQPLTFDTLDGKVSLQSISLAFPYLGTSFEELRFGDYIRGRKKAPHLFEPFRKLPPEIRCIIWRFAMMPRIVEIRHAYAMSNCWTLAKVPVLLHVSRESRYEALKRYTLAFGIERTPDKTYFDFDRDTLFLTYEKWHGEGEYEDEVNYLTHCFYQSGEAKKIRHLAIDKDLVEIFANRLEDEEQMWLDEGDDSMPEPEIEVIPQYPSLQSLSIVRTTIDGLWYHKKEECGECEERDGRAECPVKKRMQENDRAEIVPSNAYTVAQRFQQEYYRQMIAQIKGQNRDWRMPELFYMTKLPHRQKPPQGPRSAREACPCGAPGCYEDSDSF